jgi:hypothetical protein
MFKISYSRQSLMKTFIYACDCMAISCLYMRVVDAMHDTCLISFMSLLYCRRSYSRYVEKAMAISMTVEADYLAHPDENKHLFNYAVHCHVILQDIGRARKLFVEAMRRMESRGPDLPFLLYAYAVFVFTTHDLDYLDVIILMERARTAEVARDAFNRKKKGIPPSKGVEDGTFPFGLIFDFANAGFYRYAANTLNNATAWECYAACRFLVFRDFNLSFDAYMEAFKTDPKNAKLRINFDHMMEFFHGSNKNHLNAVVRSRMQYHAQKDSDLEEMRRQMRDKRRYQNLAASKIKVWFQCLSRIDFQCLCYAIISLLFTRVFVGLSFLAMV